MKINGSRLEKNDIRPARKFENEFKFLDDLTTLNDGREFVTGFKEIFSIELVLKKDNLNKNKGSFLIISFSTNSMIRQMIFLLYSKNAKLEKQYSI